MAVRSDELGALEGDLGLERDAERRLEMLSSGIGVPEMLATARGLAEEGRDPFTTDFHLPAEFKNAVLLSDIDKQKAFNRSAAQLFPGNGLIVVRFPKKKEARARGEALIDDAAYQRVALNALINWRGHHFWESNGNHREGIRPLDITHNKVFLYNTSPDIKSYRYKELMAWFMELGIVVRMGIKRGTTHALAPNVIIDTANHMPKAPQESKPKLRVVRGGESKRPVIRIPAAKVTAEEQNRLNQIRAQRTSTRNQIRQSMKSEMSIENLSEEEQMQLLGLIAQQEDAGDYRHDSELERAVREIMKNGFEDADLPFIDYEKPGSRKLYRMCLDREVLPPNRTPGWESRLRVMRALEKHIWIDAPALLDHSESEAEAIQESAV